MAVAAPELLQGGEVRGGVGTFTLCHPPPAGTAGRDGPEGTLLEISNLGKGERRTENGSGRDCGHEGRDGDVRGKGAEKGRKKQGKEKGG